MPQQKSENFAEFSERTDRLAAFLRVNLGELSEKIRISPAMFSAYRNGKYPISDKAWRKLELAEKEAGIRMEKEVGEIPEEPSVSSVLEDPIPFTSYKKQLEEMTRRAVLAEEKVSLMKRVLQSLLDQL